jgi:hypothetical protein
MAAGIGGFFEATASPGEQPDSTASSPALPPAASPRRQFPLNPNLNRNLNLGSAAPITIMIKIKIKKRKEVMGLGFAGIIF